MTSHNSQMVNRDEEHLRLLGIFHLLIAGINTALLVIFVLLPLLVGPRWLHVLKMSHASPEKLMKGLIVGILITAVYTFNGLSLKKKQHYISCIILSCIECLTNIPYGLIMGVSAILVLRRESVRELFKKQST